MKKESHFFNEYGLPAFARGDVLIEWVNLGEGFDGDYDPENPDDVNLLRFDVSVANPEAQQWDPIEDGSYCTHIPAHTHPDTLKRILTSFMDYIYDDVVSSGKAKRKCEQLSWTDLDGNIQLNPISNLFN